MTAFPSVANKLSILKVITLYWCMLDSVYLVKINF